MGRVSRAILLLAGRGLRLGHLTKKRPKCLLRVAGLPILGRTLQALGKQGVTEAILVVGYQSDQIEQFAGHCYAGINIKYVFNRRYAETNTAYSLWLAKTYLDTNCFIIEGDILFEPSVLEHLTKHFDGKSVWCCVPKDAGNDEGILLSQNRIGHVAKVRLVREHGNEQTGLTHKCAGIQLLTSEMACSLALRLDDTVSRGRIHMFADLVIGQLVGEKPISLCSLGAHKWAEVDDFEDLRRARRLFLAENGRSQLIGDKLIAEGVQCE